MSEGNTAGRGQALSQARPSRYRFSLVKENAEINCASKRCWPKPRRSPKDASSMRWRFLRNTTYEVREKGANAPTEDGDGIGRCGSRPCFRQF